MKKKLIYLSLLIFMATNLKAENRWYGKGIIASVQPEIYRTIEADKNLTFAETSIVSEGCEKNSTWVLKSKSDFDGRIYAALLTAVTSGKQVNLRQNGCHVISNESYPLIGGVKIFN